MAVAATSLRASLLVLRRGRTRTGSAWARSKQYDGLYLFREGVEGDFPLDVLRDAEAYMASKDLGGGLHVPMKLKEKSVRGPYPLRPL